MFVGDGGGATSAWLYYPTAVFVSSSGVMFISDRSNQRLRAVGNCCLVVLLLLLFGGGGVVVVFRCCCCCCCCFFFFVFICEYLKNITL